MNGLEVLALIPARGGSKGIPRKNLCEVGGVPLVVRSVLHARAAQTVTRIVVSTDDDEIRARALASGAEVPFLRPRELGLDHVLDLPVFDHALRFLATTEGYRPDLVVHLRPTCPHRRPEWIDRAVTSLWGDPTADSVRSVSPPTQHPYRVFRTTEEGYLEPIMRHEHPQPHVLRRQDLPPLYFYNCVIDVTRPATILEKRSMTGDRIKPMVMAADDVFDIDSARDLAVAQVLLDDDDEGATARAAAR